MSRSRSLIVAGAGIGGLAAGIALAKANYRVVMFERASRIEEIGAGIQLSANATRALAKLGALEPLLSRAVVPQALVVADAVNGRELARIDLKYAAMRFGSPWLLVSRADLQRTLAETALDQVDVVFQPDNEVVDFADHTRGVTVSTRSGGEATEHLAAALIGADGLRSKVRTRLHGDAPPRFHKAVAWRALVPSKNLSPIYAEPNVRLWLGAKGHLVHYPIANGEMVNLVAVFIDDWQGSDGEEVNIEKMPHDAKDWSKIPQDLIVAAKQFRRWALYDRPPLAAWGKGRATLMGDAAHPMLPFVAQGAASAIEDAVALARHLKDADEIVPALRAYEAERQPRGTRLQTASLRTERSYHTGGLPRLARNFVLRKMGGERLLDRHAWIYRHGT